jgi:flagellar motor switch protein FliN/FliY
LKSFFKWAKALLLSLTAKLANLLSLYVNERCVAKGEIVVVDNKIGITMTEIIKNDNKE